MIPWREAWQGALYGRDGFYRRPEGPAGHFATSVHSGELFAEAVAALADREGVCRVLDLASGRGELLTHLARLRPDLALTGCDIVARPPTLPTSVGWVVSPGGPDLPGLGPLKETLVLANEWLDVVPCTIAEVDEHGDVREVLVDPVTGDETLGGGLTSTDADWAAAHWPIDEADPGSRVEVGRTRDRAWARLLDQVRSGVAVAVDYGHLHEDRPAFGTLTAFRDGIEVHPVPDGTCDLTAHVAMDSLHHDTLATQRQVLADLLDASRPEAADARQDPAAYLMALSRHSTAATLRAPGGLGDFLWATVRING